MTTQQAPASAAARALGWRDLAVGAIVLLALGAAARPELPEPWVGEVSPPFFFAVLVDDTEESAAWYSAAFGLRQVDTAEAGDGSWRIVNLRGQSLAVEVIRDDRAAEAERPRGFFKVGLAVPDVTRVAERVERLGGERPRVVELEAHGIRIVQLRDPDGNRIQLSSPL